MRLDEYLKVAKIRQSAFARQIGKTPTTVRMLCDGTIWPARSTVDAIIRETGGKVTADDFVGLGPPSAVSDPIDQEASP